MNQLLANRRVNSQSRGDVVLGPQNISTERTGQWALYLTLANRVKVVDIRNGAPAGELASGNPSVGVCFNREADHFVVGELRAGAWWAVEYSYPAMAQTRAWNLTALGAATLNSLRYTVNNRYLLVGHTTGGFILNTQNGAITVTEVPVTGNVKQYECLSSMYALAARTSTAVQLTQINTGRNMPYIGDLTWDELAYFQWNWEVDEVTPYPHFIMALRQGSDWHVAPFKIGSFDFYDSKQWDIVVPEKPLAIAYSETDNSSSTIKESVYGRAFVVFFPTYYQVFDLLTGELKATLTTTQQNPITCGYWKEAQGLYL